MSNKERVHFPKETLDVPVFTAVKTWSKRHLKMIVGGGTIFPLTGLTNHHQ